MSSRIVAKLAREIGEKEIEGEREEKRKKYRANMALHFRDYAKPEDPRESPRISRVLLKSHACERGETILTILTPDAFALLPASTRKYC